MLIISNDGCQCSSSFRGEDTRADWKPTGKKNPTIDLRQWFNTRISSSRKQIRFSFSLAVCLLAAFSYFYLSKNNIKRQNMRICVCLGVCGGETNKSLKLHFLRSTFSERHSSRQHSFGETHPKNKSHYCKTSLVQRVQRCKPSTCSIGREVAGNRTSWRIH